jgi:hypothetical protein
VCLVVPDIRSCKAARCTEEPLLTSYVVEHARLKEHVATMEGGLEAKINEGYVLQPLYIQFTNPTFPNVHAVFTRAFSFISFFLSPQTS